LLDYYDDGIFQRFIEFNVSKYSIGQYHNTFH